MTGTTAQVADVRARMGRELTGDEQTLAAVLLEEAELRLKARATAAGSTWAELDALAVTSAEAWAVVRVLKNPDGYRSESDGDYSYQIDTRAAAGFLMFTTDELATLGLNGSGAFGIEGGLMWLRRRRPGHPFLYCS